METQSPSPTAVPPKSAAVYVDVENLGGAANAQAIVDHVIANWPEKQPPLRLLSLSVDGAQVEVWRLWAESRWPKIPVRVRGIQHFSRAESKNAADISITADVVADFVTDQIAAAAVVSNDSDFGVLFAKLREIALAKGMDPMPFLWIITSDGNLSPHVEMFFPSRCLWDLRNITRQTLPESAAKTGTDTASASSTNGKPALKDIIDHLVRKLPVGKFKAAAACEVVKARWPSHPDANGPNTFGPYLRNEVWPILERLGVKTTRDTSPLTYEITEEVKQDISGKLAKIFAS